MFLFKALSAPKRPLFLTLKRHFRPQVTGAENCSEVGSKGLVMGVYSDEKDPKDAGLLTPSAQLYNERSTNGRLVELLRTAGRMPKRGECRIFYGIDQIFSSVVLCGLGSECLGYDAFEMVDQGKEAIRVAAATGVKALQDMGVRKIWVDGMGHHESAAEGAGMSVWVNQEFKTKEDQKFVPQIEFYADKDIHCDKESWTIGMQKASAQNLARQLQEGPPNLTTPTLFAQNVVEILCKSGVNVEVKVQGWAQAQNMNAFLAVSKGSCEPPIFLELSYVGTEYSERPIVLIGQGVTFNCGGMNFRDPETLTHMRGDMSGAASVVAAVRAVAALKIPVNVRALIPLCENMPGCNAVKIGDVVTAMNGKTIEVRNVDNAGPLVLADALCYSQIFGPKCVVTVGTISKYMADAVGTTCSGVFTNSEEIWQQVRTAAVHTGDRVWRMPLWDYYGSQLTGSHRADVLNLDSCNEGMPCKNAAFLREFLPCGRWMHMETYNVMKTDGVDFPYLRAGMAGRPTRTLIEFVAQSVCKEQQQQQERKVACF